MQTVVRIAQLLEELASIVKRGADVIALHRTLHVVRSLGDLLRRAVEEPRLFGGLQ
jgi:putative N-acetylmannosamine-6-phosphate epimerase